MLKRARALLSNSLQCFARLDSDGAKARHANEAGRRAFRLGEKFAGGVMNVDLRIMFGMAETGRQLRRFDDGAVRYLFARGVAYDDVRARIIGGMKPQV